MRAKRYTIVTAFAFAVCFSYGLFVLHQSNPPTHAQTPGYNVVGNKVISPNGKQWTPYGFVLECLGYQSTTATTCQPTKGVSGVDFTDLAKIKATANFWHGNAVRLQVAQENLFSQSPVNASFVSKMDNEVAAANNLGLVVVLTLQEEEWNGPVFPTQSAVTFWKWMADHYKDNSNVMFDLYNEPQLTAAQSGGENNLWTIWQNGGTAPGNGQSYVGFQSLVNAIRGEGANNIVIAESNLYDRDLTQILTHKLTGGNVAYGVEVNLYTDSRNATQWNANFGQYSQSVPIMPEAFRDNAGSTCDTKSPADVPALLSYLQGIHMGAFVWTLAPGIVTTNASLTDPIGYPAAPATITCPAALSDISATNTVGPGKDLLGFFMAGTASPSSPGPGTTGNQPSTKSTNPAGTAGAANGSNNGTNTSTNPKTANVSSGSGNAGSDNKSSSPSSTTLHQQKKKSKSLSIRQTAYFGAGAIGAVAVVFFGWRLLGLRRAKLTKTFNPYPADPDLFAGTTFRPSNLTTYDSSPHDQQIIRKDDDTTNF